MDSRLVTRPVSQEASGWLKAVAKPKAEPKKAAPKKKAPAKKKSAAVKKGGGDDKSDS